MLRWYGNISGEYFPRTAFTKYRYIPPSGNSTPNCLSACHHYVYTVPSGIDVIFRKVVFDTGSSSLEFASKLISKQSDIILIWIYLFYRYFVWTSMFTSSSVRSIEKFNFCRRGKNKQHYFLHWCGSRSCCWREL